MWIVREPVRGVCVRLEEVESCTPKPGTLQLGTLNLQPVFASIQKFMQTLELVY